MPYDPDWSTGAPVPATMFEWARSLPFEVNQAALGGLVKIVGDMQETVAAMWRDAAQSYDSVMDRAFNDCAQMVLERARQLSGYEYYTLADLRDMGHPYSTKYSSGAEGLPDYIVNTHTGVFFSDWRVSVVKAGGEYEIQLDNDAPYAKFLFSGTSKMRQRPILEAAFEQTLEQRTERIAEAVKEADP